MLNDLPKLSSEMQEICEGPIKDEKVLLAVKLLKNKLVHCTANKRILNKCLVTFLAALVRPLVLQCKLLIQDEYR